jgi:hypothetical protein
MSRPFGARRARSCLGCSVSTAASFGKDEGCATLIAQRARHRKCPICCGIAIMMIRSRLQLPASRPARNGPQSRVRDAACSRSAPAVVLMPSESVARRPRRRAGADAEPREIAELTPFELARKIPVKASSLNISPLRQAEIGQRNASSAGLSPVKGA